MIIKGVKITFLYYPFKINLENKFEQISIPNIMTLGTMKFYTLGRRGKWKNYVDLYFILNSGYKFGDISSLAQDIFAGGYNEKLLREQLCYFEDIDYNEEVEFIEERVDNKDIEKYLISVSCSS